MLTYDEKIRIMEGKDMENCFINNPWVVSFSCSLIFFILGLVFMKKRRKKQGKKRKNNADKWYV